MPTTPGERPLNGVHEEAKAIRDIVKKHNAGEQALYSTETLKHPTQGAVLTEMGEHDIIHFACHGASDPIDPSGSHLLLRKMGPEGPTVDELKIINISTSKSIGRARICYLSACSTAQVKANALLDENIHLASAFQVAGFTHVIGTLWRANDQACVELAKLFYYSLTKAGNFIDLDNRAVARALKDAVLQIRHHSAYTPISWASFVHFGA